MKESTQGWKRAMGNILQIATAAMVTALFVVWIVFGQTTVAKQNQAILHGVQQQLNDMSAQFAPLQQADSAILHLNADSLDAIVCILRVAPEDRTNRAVRACLIDSGVKP